jgi:DNA-binding CsgD family transcriptional regulator
MATKNSAIHAAQPARPGTGQDCELLMRKLVAQAGQSDAASTSPGSPARAPLPGKNGPPEEGSDQVLMECNVDGARWLLVRSRPEPGSCPPLSLSPREREIARLVAKGYPNKMIAAVLEISIWTVSTHLRRMFAKFGVSSRAALVAKMSRGTW